jgi:hypothetical protein
MYLLHAIKTRSLTLIPINSATCFDLCRTTVDGTPVTWHAMTHSKLRLVFCTFCVVIWTVYCQNACFSSRPHTGLPSNFTAPTPSTQVALNYNKYYPDRPTAIKVSSVISAGFAFQLVIWALFYPNKITSKLLL